MLNNCGSLLSDIEEIKNLTNWLSIGIFVAGVSTKNVTFNVITLLIIAGPLLGYLRYFTRSVIL